LELYGLVMVAGKEHVDELGLMSDGPHEMTVQGVGWYWMWQRNLVDTGRGSTGAVASAP